MIMLVAMMIFATIGVAMSVVMMVVVARRRARFGLHVSAALGIERGFERDNASPKSFGHRLDDRIASDAQRFRQDFSWQMPVAEMPSDACQSEPISRPDLSQRLRRGDHLDNASVLEAQSVAAAQHRGFREIKQEG
jgi:hypothetical protein